MKKIATLLLTIFFGLSLLQLSGCSSPPSKPVPQQTPAKPKTITEYKTKQLANASQSKTIGRSNSSHLTYSKIETLLRSESRDWIGTPHRMGGTGKNGIDCSGLVNNLYADLFQVSLPRTTTAMANRGAVVRRSELRPGDLVFFNISWRKKHVGIYLGRGEFIHTSSKRGVMISHVEEAYWRRHWWTARRILLTAG